MSGDVKYLVDIDYRLAGVEKALANTKAAGAAADKLARSMEWVKRAALAVGASFVFGKVKSALIDSNRELESMQIGMSAVLGMSLSMPFEKAEPIAARLVEHYRQIAKVSPGTTQDFLQFNNAISGAVLNAGGTLGELKAITAGGFIGGQAFGFRADVAAKDVQQALTGNVTMQTPFIKMLLGSESDIAKFNAMTGPERVKKLKEVLEGPALKKAAQKFGESYEGQLSTLKDTAQNTFRAIGAPLFRQLTSWLKQINAWADRNAAKLQSMAHDVGNALTTGARWLVKAGTFLVENKATFLALAAGLTIGKMAGGIAGGVAAGGGVASSLAKLASTANLTALALGGLAAGIAYVVSRKDSWGNQTTREIETYFASKGAGAMAANLLVNRGQYDYGQGGNAVLAGLGKLTSLKQAWDEENLRKKQEKDAAQPKNPKVNVTIKKIEVVANDPDRLVHAMVKRIGKELRAPGQSIMLPRGT